MPAAIFAQTDTSAEDTAQPESTNGNRAAADSPGDSSQQRTVLDTRTSSTAIQVSLR